VAGGGFGFVILRAEGVGAKGGVGSTELGGGAADLAVEGAPGGIDEACGFRSRAERDSLPTGSPEGVSRAKQWG